MTEIGESAFSECSGLVSVTIPLRVTRIGPYAFFKCDELTSVNIPSGVSIIGKSAFYHCGKLTEVSIPLGVKSIGDYAFYYCSGLTSVTIPSSVTNVGAFAFYGCSGLGSMTLSWSTLGYVLVGCEIRWLFPTIGQYAFSGCASLEIVYVRNNGDVGALKQSLAESGFNITDVLFNTVDCCNVLFDAYGGFSERAGIEIRTGTKVGPLPIAERCGYEFLGWFTEIVGGVRVMEESIINECCTFYAHWKEAPIAMPDIDPLDGTMFATDSCKVSISCPMADAAIYFRVGAAPKVSDKYLYSGPFIITETSRIYSYVVIDGRSSPTNVATITKEHVLTFAEAASADGVENFSVGGDAGSVWIPVKDADAKVGEATKWAN